MKNGILFACVLFFFISITGYCVHAQKSAGHRNSAQGATRVTQVEGVTEFDLPNGLRVLLFPDASRPEITVNITYMVGSRMEGYGETGMAHLLEHMLFKGSSKHPHIPDELTAHGASPNGSTSYDRTNYFESFTSTDENLNWALSLEADRMVNSFIAEKDLKSEFSVVRNEFEAGENYPPGILEERVLSTMYLWHNYGKATIGSKEDIEKVPVKNLQAFYKKYYQPDNATLMVAGKIDETKTLAMVVKYFGAIPRPARVLDPEYTMEPVQDGERSVTLNRVGDVQEISAGYHIPAGPDPLFAAFDVLNEVLTAKPDGRIYQALVKPELIAGVSADNPALKDPSYFYITASVLKTKSVDIAKDALLALLDELSSKPVTSEEVEKAKNKLLRNFDETYRNTKDIGLAISEYIAQGDWRLAFIYRDNLKKVTADDVNRAIRDYLVPSNRTVGQFVPDSMPKRALAPQHPDVASIVKDYKGREALPQAEAFDPSPANLDKRSQKGNIPGGGKYVFLSKTTRGNTVEGVITLRIGDEKSLENKASVASLAAAMLKRGTKNNTLSQINEKLDKLSSSIDISASGQTITVSVKSTRQNLPLVLDLVFEMLRQPTFPDDELKTLKNERLAELEQERSDPQSIAFREYSRTMKPRLKGNIHYVMTIDEEEDGINRASLGEVGSFYWDFYNGSNATAAFVGDFDQEIAKVELNKILANWNGKKNYIRIADAYEDVNPKNKEIKTPDKKNAVLVCGMNLKMRDDDPDFAALKMGNFIFGGGFLNSRLATRIRQKEGISYGVGSFIRINSQDESGEFVSYAIYNPENKSKLEAAWADELNKFVNQGITEEELKQAKSGYIQYRESSRSDDGQLAALLNAYLYIDRTMAWEKELDDKLGKLTASQVNSVLKRLLSVSRITFVKAGDFK